MVLFDATKLPQSLQNDSAAMICVSHVSKVYHLFDRASERLKQALWGNRRSYGQAFAALNDVSFEVPRGEILGIIGRNGSGKSTLLQLLAGVMQPTCGTIRVQGRIGALLELGSGFDPEYTGRENVFMNGAILGIGRAQMQERFDEIAAFADIGQFIDQPVKSYSSGMFVRLAFAVQASLSPDVLIVDEALSVGDVSFQRKCYRRLDELRDRGTTVLFVSHDLNAISSFCTRAIMLERGQLVHEGSPIEVVEEYQKLLFGGDAAAPTQHYGDGSADFEDIWLESEDGQRIDTVSCQRPFNFCYRVRFNRDITQPVFGTRLHTVQGVVIWSSNTQMLNIQTADARAGDVITLRWPCAPILLPGNYFLSCGVSYQDQERFLCRRPDALKLTITGTSPMVGVCSGLQRPTMTSQPGTEVPSDG